MKFLSEKSLVTAHTGDDCTVAMFDEETTDNATFRIHGENPEEAGKRLSAVWNACLGLELSAGVQPGALAEVVAALQFVNKWRKMVVEKEGFDPLPVQLSQAVRDAVAKFAPVSVNPDLPEAVRLAFEEVRRYFPGVVRVRFFRESDGFQSWEFTEPDGNAPEFPYQLDDEILFRAVEWVALNADFPQEYSYTA